MERKCLLEWIKNVVICSILFSMMLHIAPDPKMRRYIQTAVGFVMMIVVLTPVIKLAVSDEQILFNVYEESIGMEINAGDDDVYVKSMELVIEQFVADRYGVDVKADITLTENMEIDSIGLAVDYREMNREGISMNENDFKGIADAVASEYGISADRIIIM